MRQRRVFYGILALLLLLASGRVAKLVLDAGAFRKLIRRGGEHCRTIAALPGTEDMELVGRRLYISSDHRPEHPGAPTAPGDIWFWNIDDPTARPERLTVSLPFELHPHGISAIRMFTGEVNATRLFVVNHGRDQSVIEVFDHIDGQTLLHQQTLRDPLIITPNDIAAVSGDEFYFTNDHGSRSHLRQTLEAYARVGSGSLVHYGGAEKGFRLEEKEINFANGLWLTADRAYLFVAAMLERQIRIYRRDNGTLSLATTLSLDTAPDNVQLDAAGDLWVGAHPNLFKLKAHAANHTTAAPAQILRIAAPLAGLLPNQASGENQTRVAATPAIEEILLDDGTLVSAASVAVHDGKRVFIGTIYEPKLIECTLP